MPKRRATRGGTARPSRTTCTASVPRHAGRHCTRAALRYATPPRTAHNHLCLRMIMQRGTRSNCLGPRKRHCRMYTSRGAWCNRQHQSAWCLARTAPCAAKTEPQKVVLSPHYAQCVTSGGKGCSPVMYTGGKVTRVRTSSVQRGTEELHLRNGVKQPPRHTADRSQRRST